MRYEARRISCDEDLVLNGKFLRYNTGIIALVEKAKQDFSLSCHFAVDGKQFLTENHVDTPTKSKRKRRWK